ncbi:MAG: glycosyltransferase family 2 protein [Nitrospirota bacterium]|nr:glycosyltransferase family 2 protein [Nitrospirota bacterium]
MPQVTVVLPVYNGARYIREALDSVFAQTFRDFEVICIDNGSTDETRSILEGYGERIRVLRRENRGPCGGRNEGVRKATAQYIAFLDHDDCWYPRKLEQQVAVLSAEPDAVLVLCNSDRMDAEGRLLQVGATSAERATMGDSPLGRLMEADQLLSSAILVRRDAFERAGMYDEELRGFEDFDLCARLKREGRFVFLEEPGMCYRVHSASLSHAGKAMVVQSRERFLLRMKALYVGDELKQELIRIMLAECYSDWGMHEVKAGRKNEGRRMLLRSLRLNPHKLRTYSRLFRSYL